MHNLAASLEVDASKKYIQQFLACRDYVVLSDQPYLTGLMGIGDTQCILFW